MVAITAYNTQSYKQTHGHYQMHYLPASCWIIIIIIIIVDGPYFFVMHDYYLLCSYSYLLKQEQFLLIQW